VSLTARDQWAEARRLVVAENYTYEEVANALNLPVSTIQKRAAREGWQDQRQASFGYAQTVRRLKALALQKALAAIEAAESADDIGKATQLLYAWQKTEQAYPEHRYVEQEVDPRLHLRVGLEVVEELVSFLVEVDRAALAAIQPHLVPFAQRLEAAHAK